MATKKSNSFLNSYLKNIEKEYCAKFDLKMHRLTMSHTTCGNSRIVLQLGYFNKIDMLLLWRVQCIYQILKIWILYRHT